MSEIRPDKKRRVQQDIGEPKRHFPSEPPAAQLLDHDAEARNPSRYEVLRVQKKIFSENPRSKDPTIILRISLRSLLPNRNACAICRSFPGLQKPFPYAMIHGYLFYNITRFISKMQGGVFLNYTTPSAIITGDFRRHRSGARQALCQRRLPSFSARVQTDGSAAIPGPGAAGAISYVCSYLLLRYLGLLLGQRHVP